MNNKDFDIKNEFEKLLQKEPMDNKIDILAALLTGNYKPIFEEYANDFIANADNAVINAHCVYDFCADLSFSFFTLLIEQNLIDESCMDSYKALINTWSKKNAELDNEFRKTVSKIDPDNIPIKTFPENTTDGEKELLNRLAKNYHIKRELSQNNKFPLFNKHGAKRLVKALYEYEPSFTANNAYTFMIMFIETGLEGCIIQNYCREVKKDMPIRNSKTHETGNKNGL
jgi:hypothetical protein